jgi:integrase/recombinase XerD
MRPEHIRNSFQSETPAAIPARMTDRRNRPEAFRFFLIAMLKRAWSIAETPYPRKAFRLPKILSPEQVSGLFDAAPTAFYRMP